MGDGGDRLPSHPASAAYVLGMSGLAANWLRFVIWGWPDRRRVGIGGTPGIPSPPPAIRTGSRLPASVPTCYADRSSDKSRRSSTPARGRGMDGGSRQSGDRFQVRLWDLIVVVVGASYVLDVARRSRLAWGG